MAKALSFLIALPRGAVIERLSRNVADEAYFELRQNQLPRQLRARAPRPICGTVSESGFRIHVPGQVFTLAGDLVDEDDGTWLESRIETNRQVWNGVAILALLGVVLIACEWSQRGWDGLMLGIICCVGGIAFIVPNYLIYRSMQVRLLRAFVIRLFADDADVPDPPGAPSPLQESLLVAIYFVVFLVGFFLWVSVISEYLPEEFREP